MAMTNAVIPRRKGGIPHIETQLHKTTRGLREPQSPNGLTAIAHSKLAATASRDGPAPPPAINPRAKITARSRVSTPSYELHQPWSGTVMDEEAVGPRLRLQAKHADTRHEYRDGSQQHEPDYVDILKIEDVGPHGKGDRNGRHR